MSDRAGAVGYLLKDRVMAVDQFVSTVRQVAAGNTVMDPDVVTKLGLDISEDDNRRILAVLAYLEPAASARAEARSRRRAGLDRHAGYQGPWYSRPRTKAAVAVPRNTIPPTMLREPRGSPRTSHLRFCGEWRCRAARCTMRFACKRGRRLVFVTSASGRACPAERTREMAPRARGARRPVYGTGSRQRRR